MFARMLFPTDLTADSQALLDCLPEFRTAGLKQVVLLNVIRKSEVPMGKEIVNADSLAFVRRARQEHLHVAQLALEGQGLSALTRVEYGDPAQEIARVADEERVDWIGMGTEGWNAPMELLIGGTLFNVLRRTFVPVLILKFDLLRELGHAKCREGCRRVVERALHPTDLSHCASVAFDVVKRLRAAGTKEVVLLHVQGEHTQLHHHPDPIARMRRELTLYGLPTKVLSRRGDVCRETLAVAEEEDASVIVVGLQGRSAFQEMLSGGSFEAIVRQSRKPVLVVRGESHASVTP